jgi:hypothetical protein
VTRWLGWPKRKRGGRERGVLFMGGGKLWQERLLAFDIRYYSSNART